MRSELTTQLPGDDPSPQSGYETAKELLARKIPFTALVVYNDISAVGAIRAIKETGLRVPEDISVVGFDDIREAAYHLPSLTTVRQPMRKIGAIAAEALIERLEGRNGHVEGILVSRNSSSVNLPDLCRSLLSANRITANPPSPLLNNCFAIIPRFGQMQTISNIVCDDFAPS